MTDKSVENYSKILDSNPDYNNRQKCRICGKDIFYKNVTFSGVCSKNLTINGGTSHLSVKKIGDTIYHIGVCEKMYVTQISRVKGQEY